MVGGRESKPPRQAKPSVITEGVVGYRCRLNYRSPESIARFMRNMLPFEFELGNDLPGLGMGVHGVSESNVISNHSARVV